MRRQKLGFTLVELLVVIAIIGILIALLLPAVQAAREAARRSQCSNNLKQIGLSIHNFHDVNNGAPPATVNRSNMATWAVFILPYMEQENLYKRFAIGREIRFNTTPKDPGKFTPVDSYVCPSRRSVGQAYTQDNSNDWGGACSDYAGSGGSDDFYGRRKRQGANGFFVIPETYRSRQNDSSITDNFHLEYRPAHGFEAVTDGTSNTLMVGEKNIPAYHLGKKNPSQLDGPVYRGKNNNDLHSVGWSIRRAGPGYGIMKDMHEDCGAQQNRGARNLVCGMVFGSWHAGGVCQFLRVDGSVSKLNPSMDEVTLGYLAQVNDGKATSE